MLNEQDCATNIRTGTSSNDDCKEAVSQVLQNAFPDEITVDFDGGAKHTKTIIEESNEKAKSVIIKAYADNENERVNRQKYLLWAVVILTAVQMIFFNAVIAVVVYYSFKSNNQSTISCLFDILKYYIGATVVELIGMIVYITSGTFSSSHYEAMKMLFQGKKIGV